MGSPCFCFSTSFCTEPCLGFVLSDSLCVTACFGLSGYFRDSVSSKYVFTFLSFFWASRVVLVLVISLILQLWSPYELLQCHLHMYNPMYWRLIFFFGNFCIINAISPFVTSNSNIVFIMIIRNWVTQLFRSLFSRRKKFHTN